MCILSVQDVLRWPCPSVCRGKTALAATIAIESGFPFIKIVSSMPFYPAEKCSRTLCDYANRYVINIEKLNMQRHKNVKMFSCLKLVLVVMVFNFTTSMYIRYLQRTWSAGMSPRKMLRLQRDIAY